jgi:hypothetical protein
VSAEPSFWNPLFAGDAPANARIPVRMRLLTKHGQPLLLLPEQARLATHSLTLYPAQTARGRLARFAARCILTTRLPLGVQSVALSFAPDHPFVRWLAGLTATPQGLTPFAVLAGNPNSPGQRLILLLFNAAGQPAVVVKAGVTAPARELIARERQFFESLPADAPRLNIPRLRGFFANDQMAALALDFLPGRSPLPCDAAQLPRLLSDWLRPQWQIALADTRAGHELVSACGAHPVFQAHLRVFHQRRAAAIYHGDFAPWNVRVSPQGQWMVLDWERGELSGLPTWDWFHYVIQKAILVQRQPPPMLAATVERLLASPEFEAYLHASQSAGDERTLLLLYLLYQVEVIRPGEGRARAAELLQLLAARWR